MSERPDSASGCSARRWPTSAGAGMGSVVPVRRSARRNVVILAECLVGECLPLAYLRRWHDDPLPEHLTAPGWVEEMRAGYGKGPSVRIGIRQLEHHPCPREAEHHLPGALHAWHAEHLRGARIVVPVADRIDDVLVGCAIVHGRTIRLERQASAWRSTKRESRYSLTCDERLRPGVRTAR